MVPVLLFLPLSSYPSYPPLPHDSGYSFASTAPCSTCDFPLLYVSVLPNMHRYSACNTVLRYYALDAMGVTISLHRYRIE